MLIVKENDPGIRPAGKPDECFYCKSKVGELHKKDCVIVVKKVRVQYTFIIEEDMPISWTKENIEFLRNESSSCMDNALQKIADYAEEYGCSCDFGEAEYLGDVDTTPRYAKD